MSWSVPRCGSRMRILAAIEDPVVARKILDSLGLPSRPPPVAPARHNPHSPNSDAEPAAFANVCRHAAIVSIRCRDEIVLVPVSRLVSIVADGELLHLRTQ